MIRTRQLLDGKDIDYDDLVHHNLIPDLVSISPAIVNKNTKYPYFVYQKKDFSLYGVIMEYIVRAYLARKTKHNVELGLDPAEEEISEIPPSDNKDELLGYLERYNDLHNNNLNSIARSSRVLANLIYNKDVYTQKEIDSNVGFLTNIMKELLIAWEEYPLEGTLRYNLELQSKLITGHPDIILDNAILDVKNAAKFSTSMKYAYLQILTYYALANDPKIKYVGIVLPMQRDIILFDVSKWNSSDYLKYLQCVSEQMINSTYSSFLPGNQETLIQLGSFDDIVSSLLMTDHIMLDLEYYGIGSHIKKSKKLVDDLLNYHQSSPGVPWQIFLTPSRSYNISKDIDRDVLKYRDVITRYNIPVYVHSPYIISLCSTDPVKSSNSQHLLNSNMSYAYKAGMRGVVVHTGSNDCGNVDNALNIMETKIRRALSHTHESCPILLETMYSGGKQVCCTKEDLCAFYDRFNEHEKRKLGVCIDTCHVFAAGYDPLEYLQYWYDNSDIPIVLVHFNDSKNPKGSGKDNHEAPGLGYIGREKLKNVAIWCNERNIHMVNE